MSYYALAISSQMQLNKALLMVVQASIERHPANTIIDGVNVGGQFKKKSDAGSASGGDRTNEIDAVVDDAVGDVAQAEEIKKGLKVFPSVDALSNAFSNASETVQALAVNFADSLPGEELFNGLASLASDIGLGDVLSSIDPKQFVIDAKEGINGFIDRQASTISKAIEEHDPTFAAGLGMGTFVAVTGAALALSPPGLSATAAISAAIASSALASRLVLDRTERQVRFDTLFWGFSALSNFALPPSAMLTGLMGFFLVGSWGAMLTRLQVSGSLEKTSYQGLLPKLEIQVGLPPSVTKPVEQYATKKASQAALQQAAEQQQTTQSS